MHRQDIRLRDPFVVVWDGRYYLYGTPCDYWEAHPRCLPVYVSDDLVDWSEPAACFQAAADFWADRDYWAPEVHRHGERWYMFCSFKAEHRCRGTQILVADSPLGPFQPLTAQPVTPAEWECLDGTWYRDREGRCWLVYCHEWVQCGDGELWAQELTADLTAPQGQRHFLFRASDAPWVTAIQPGSYVTDGPFLYEAGDGTLRMLWSSFGKDGYALGQAVSSGGITGPWTQPAQPVFHQNGGHGMVFRDLQGRLRLALHAPNTSPQERPVFLDMDGRL